MKYVILGWFVIGGLMACAPDAAAQPEQLDMQAIAQALGVECSYCHVERRNAAGANTGTGAAPAGQATGDQPKIAIAKEMIAMTRELNARIQAATGKPPVEAARVQCVTCHRGVAIPRQLSDIIIRTAFEKGGEAAVDQYRDLRRRYYGRQAYDFSEAELLGVAERLSERRPDAAIGLLTMNLEFNPKSARTYQIMAHAYTRKRDDATAIAHLEKALEIEPENGVARGQLEQLRQYQRLR